MLDASGQALVYVYARETREQADIAKVLTFDEARPVAVPGSLLLGVKQTESMEKRTFLPECRLPGAKRS